MYVVTRDERVATFRLCSQERANHEPVLPPLPFHFSNSPPASATGGLPRFKAPSLTPPTNQPLTTPAKPHEGNHQEQRPARRDPAASAATSTSGKTLTVATTRGNRPTEAKVNGKPVTIGLNAYIDRDLNA